jgi:MFS family permease
LAHHPLSEPSLSEAGFSGRRRLSLILCAFLHGLNHALQLILPPLYVAIREDLGIDGLSPVMLLGTIYFVVYAVVGLPYGILADRFSKKRMLVLGTLVNSLAFVMVAYSGSYPVLVAAMVLGGLGGGTYHPVGNALIANLFRDMVGRAFGIAGVGASLGLFVGPFASGVLAQHFGWRASCMAFAVFGVAVAAAFAAIMPDDRSERTSAGESHAPGRMLLAAVLPVIAVFGVRDFSWWGITYLSPAMAQTSLGFTLERAGMVIGLMSLTGVLSQPLAGMMSDRFGRKRVIAVSLSAAAPCVFFFPHAGQISLFPLALVVGFLMLATVPVVDAAAAEIVPTSMRGRLFGLMMTLGILMGALSPYVVGIIHDLAGGYAEAYVVLAVTALLGAGLSLVVFRH